MSNEHTIIQAIAQLISMAVEYAGYRLAMFVMMIVFTTPLHFLIAYLVVNIAMIAFIISKWSNRFIDWIAGGVRTIWEWLRQKKKSQTLSLG